MLDGTALNGEGFLTSLAFPDYDALSIRLEFSKLFL